MPRTVIILAKIFKKFLKIFAKMITVLLKWAAGA